MVYTINQSLTILNSLDTNLGERFNEEGIKIEKCSMLSICIKFPCQGKMDGSNESVPMPDAPVTFQYFCHTLVLSLSYHILL